MAVMKGDFIQNLGKIYAIYTGGFIGFTIFLAILEQLGPQHRRRGGRHELATGGDSGYHRYECRYGC